MKRMFLFCMALLFNPLIAFAHGNNDICRFGWGSYGIRSLGYLVVLIFFISVILIGWAVYFIIKKGMTVKHSNPLEETPLDIIKKRYAKGEISKEEFEQIKKDLSK